MGNRKRSSSSPSHSPLLPLFPFSPFPSKPGIITFADPTVKALCVEHWDTDGDGELSQDEAA